MAIDNLMSEFLEIPIEQWAEAIALRISDEWEGNDPNNPDSAEDVELLRNTLEKALIACPELCIDLIGTTIIEESYFGPLD